MPEFNPFEHDPLLMREHNVVEWPAEGMEELGLAGPAEGLDRATSEAFDPDSPTRWQTISDPYDEDEDKDEEPVLQGDYTCYDLAARGHWDTHDCCSECHETSALPPPPVLITHAKTPHKNVIVRGCCALHDYLHNHLVKGHEDFLADLFGGDD